MISNLLAFMLFGQVVLGIEAQSRFVDEALILTTAGLNKGGQYNERAVTDAIQKLYNLGLFDQVEIDTNRLGDGVYVTISVTENPILKSEPVFSGNKKIKSKTIKEKVNLKSGETLSRKKIFDAKRTIVNLYQDKGYYLTTVTDSLTVPDSMNRSDITFVIDDGKKVKIKHIEIEGNRALTDKQVKKKLSNKERRWYRSGNFKEEKFAEDLDKIVELYQEKGYLDAKVTNKELNQQDRWLNIVITVEEGKLYYVGNLDFSGNKNITTQALQKALKMKKGEPFNLKKSKETIRELSNLYAEDGYIFAQIVPDEKNVRGHT